LSTTQKTKAQLIDFVDANNERLWHIRGLPDFDVIALGNEVFKAAHAAEYPFGIARATLNSAMGAFIGQNNVTLALRLLEEALNMFKDLDNKKWVANTHCTLGIVHNTIQNPEPALYNALHALDYYENHPEDTHDIAMVYYVVATIYKDLKKYKEAEHFYRKGCSCADISTSSWGGRVFAGLANVYMMLDRNELALEYSFLGLEKMRAENNNIGESRALTDIGVTYRKMKRYPEALQFLEEGLKMRITHGVKQFAISSLMEIASLHRETGNIPLAIKNFEDAEALAIEISQMGKLGVIYKEFSAIYKQTSDFPKALFYSEKLVELNTDLHKKEIEKRISNLQGTFLKEKEDEIERLKNVELKGAYDLISIKNKEILDSIHYAKRIQQSILPTDIYIERHLNRLHKR
jgi:tetratricopeptide (TPR) repeat protein